MIKLKWSSVFVALALSSAVMADNLTFKWDAVTLNADGTPCTDLGGYKLYRGTAKGIYGPAIEVGNVTTYVHSETKDGKYYYAVSAYDTSGNESGVSNEVTVTIDHTAPKPPSNFSLLQKILTAILQLLGKRV